jgi:hypothetical protein
MSYCKKFEDSGFFRSLYQYPSAKNVRIFPAKNAARQRRNPISEYSRKDAKIGEYAKNYS